MSQDQQQYYPVDEFNLFEMILNIWEGKFWIAFVTIISIAAGTAYIFIPSHPVKASIEILAAPFSETVRFAPLNREFKQISEMVYFTNLDRGFKLGAPIKFTEIGADNLIKDFEIELSRGTGFKTAIIESGVIQKRASESEADFSARAKTAAKKFRVTQAKIDKKGVVINHIDVSIIAPNAKIAKKALEVAITLVNSTIKESMWNTMQIQKEGLQQARRLSLEKNGQMRLNAIAKYDIETAERIAYLYEQLKIARRLNIKKYNLIARRAIELSDDTSIANISRDTPYYLWGYIAIEKEINLLKGRTNKMDFITELVELDQKRRVLEQDYTIKRFDTAVQMADFNSETFRAAQYNFDEIQIIPTFRWFLVLVLSAAFGLIGGTVGYVFWRGIRNLPKKNNATV